MADDLDTVAGRIVASRSVFEQLYDRLIEPKIPDAMQFRALAVLRDRRVPNVSGRAKDYADFSEALRQADKFHLLLAFIADSAPKLFVEPEQETGVLQAIVSRQQVFPAGLPLTMGRIAALRRTCRVRCTLPSGEEEKGTGFLIGPHLVLTNWHVVKSMLEAGKEKDGSPSRMKFEFDVLLRADGSLETPIVLTPVRNWLVISSEAHPNEIAGGGAGPYPNNPDELADKLDFAVVELDGAPGLNRGWYDINESTWPQSGTTVDLYQHPLGRALTYLTQNFVAPTVFRDNSQPPRIEHLVNTEKGSSGGLCLDLASRAVALHQAGLVFRAGTNSEGRPAEVAVRNAAIPLKAIAAVAGSMVRQRIASAPRILRASPTGLPIVGRQRFQTLVDVALRGNIRILSVQTSFDQVTRLPASKIGKSFSETILRALLPAPHNVVFCVPAARLMADAYKAARLIVGTVHPPNVESVPSAPSGQTSLDADAVGTLIPPVIDAMRAAAGDGILWLAIDDLDRNPVQSESTTSTFLNALYKAVAIESKLRIVLIGPTAALPGLTGLPFDTDLLNHISDDDVATWIEGELGPRLPVLPQFARLMADIARSVADELAKDPSLGKTGAIARVLQTHWAPKIRAPR